MSLSTSPHFHLFPLLPSELRLKIWVVALSIPRTLEFSCERCRYEHSTRRYARAFHCSAPLPALLSVCRESRLEALVIYSPFFSTPESTKKTYVAFDQDIIHLQEGVLAYLGRAELDAIQNMVLDVKDYAYFGFYNMDIIKGMKSLEALDLVVDRELLHASWQRPYVVVLSNEFNEAKQGDPLWQCPRIRIFSSDSGKLVHHLDGAL